MLKTSLRPIPVLLCTIAGLVAAFVVLFPRLFDSILSNHFYGYSILLFFVSLGFVLAIVRRSSVYSPSLFLLIFFVAVPLFGPLNARQFFDEVTYYFGRDMPSFDFPTFLWSVGTVFFFGGVLLAWLLLPRSRRNYKVLWDRTRMLLFLKISLLLAFFGTLLAFYKIGYVPFLRSDIADVRTGYFNTVGPLTSRFSMHWPVPALLSSMLFFLERGKKKLMYLCITIICTMGMLFYAQRTGFVWVISAFGLMYFKFLRPRPLRLLAIAGIALLLVYGMMIQAEYRGALPSDGSTISSRITRHTFSEWSQFSIVVNEARSGSDYLGWKIFVGPFFTLVPRQIYDLLGYDKGALMMQYSAVYHYGREFDELYGIRIGPIGEAFAAYGFGGVILQMTVLGIFFGAFERTYFGLEKDDARLCVVCYLLSLMLHLPITTMFMLLVPLTVTGVFVFAYYVLGTRKDDRFQPERRGTSIPLAG